MKFIHEDSFEAQPNHQKVCVFVLMLFHHPEMPIFLQHYTHETLFLRPRKIKEML